MNSSWNSASGDFKTCFNLLIIARSGMNTLKNVLDAVRATPFVLHVGATT